MFSWQKYRLISHHKLYDPKFALYVSSDPPFRRSKKMEAVSHHFSIADMRHSQAPIIHPARPECSNERSLLEFILLYYFLQRFVIQLKPTGRLFGLGLRLKLKLNIGRYQAPIIHPARPECSD